MGFRFVCGRAGTGKSSLCLDEIRQELHLNAWGTPLILLVPEQATYQMEVVLANTLDLGGSLRAQVLSFRRLAWRVFAETGGGQKVLIGASGKRMLLRRILLHERFNLQALASSAAKPGMADLLARAIGELKTYRIKPADLGKIKNSNELLRAKLQDLALIYTEFQAALGAEIRDSDDELAVLAAKIPEAPLLQGAMVWVDGFTGFTPQELEVLRLLMTVAREVVVTLPLDHSRLTEEEQSESAPGRAGEDLFSGPWRTYQDLRRLAVESGVVIRTPSLLAKAKRYKHPWLGHVEKHFFAYPTAVYVSRGPLAEGSVSAVEEEAPLGEGIQIFSAVNRRDEVEGVARELRRLARDEGLCWREMAVLTRDLVSYHELVNQVFTAYEIPHFSDYKRPVLHHPLLELLQALPEIAGSNWAYEPLFRCLKTGFFPLPIDTVDRLENYVLEYGVCGEGWTRNVDWKYHRQWSLGPDEDQLAVERQIQVELNLARQTVYDFLSPFTGTVGSHGRNELLSVGKITEALYTCLEDLDVPATLEKWSQEAQGAGEFTKAGLHGQIWEAVIQVLDEIVAGLGETGLELEEYALILASGLEAIELGLIPPGLDQVLVGSLDRSRNPEVRVLFLLGANEGALPARPDDGGLFDGEEREFLAREGIVLAPRGKEQIYEEQFYIYTALTRAREKLVVSYPLTDEEGKGLAASTVVARLTNLFPLAKTYYLGNQKDIEWISQADFAFQAYAEQLRTLRKGEKPAPLWQAAEMWFKRDAQRQKQVQWLQDSLWSQNQEESVRRPLARRLYGKNFKVSVSRLEQFIKCPFSHYARYGLRLRERSVYRLGSPDLGEFFHALLRDFAGHLQSHGLDWGKLTVAESWALVNELTERLVPELRHEILLSNARYRYLTHKLKRTVHHAVRVLGEHARRGLFIPIQLEVGFGPGEILPGMDIPLAEGDSLLLSGQIDRIDAAFLDGKVYLRVLDYKSRELALSLDSIYYGLNLQLPIYLDVALQGAEVFLQGAEVLLPATSQSEGAKTSSEASLGTSSDNVAGDTPGEPREEFPRRVPAGFLYFPVLEPQLEEQAPLSPEELEQRRLKAVKVSGYLLADPRVLEAMDASLGTGQSDLLGLRLKKDGSLSKGAKVLTEEQFSLLRDYLRRKLEQTGERIIKGEISLSPYRRGKDTGCTYCAYKPVCHFDPSLPENRYQELPPLKQEEVWRRLESGES